MAHPDGAVAGVRLRGPVVLAAGGTGGHLFPAEALGAALGARGHQVVLMTDRRGGGERSAGFGGPVHVIAGAGLVGRGAGQRVGAGAALLRGVLQARRLLRGMGGAAAVVGFGGYPSVGPVLAARVGVGRPAVVLHEGNAVLGGANRVMARMADAVALTVADTAGVPAGARAEVVGIPVRPGVAALAGRGYVPPEDGPVRVLVVGGSLGARVLADRVPGALGALGADVRARLQVVQQCRAEDEERVRAAYAALGIAAELRPFFSDMPHRLQDAHLVIGRAGASTCAELAVAGRPAVLVPLPSPDGHQARNAAAIGAAVVEQAALASDGAALTEAVAAMLVPGTLAASAARVAAVGIADAAERLADLVERVAVRQ